MNSVLAIVHIIPGDRIIKEKPLDTKAEVKPEVKVEGDEAKEELEGEEKMGEEEAKAEEEEDDEVPYIEDVGTREVAGFIVM